MSLKTCRFTASGSDTSQVAEVISQALSGEDSDLTILFSTRDCDLPALEKELRSVLQGPVLGCTTAGEIGPDGFQQGTVVGVTLKGELDVTVVPIPSLQNLDSRALSAVRQQCRQHTKTCPDGWSSFGVVLIDGLSGAEERLMASLHSILPDIPLVGGSAGDDLCFEQTGVWLEGRFQTDAAVLAIINTPLPWSLIKTQHICERPQIMVITEAAPDRRIVFEIDGMPAADAYAARVGVPIEALGPDIFSRYPMVLRIGDEVFVRSIQRAQPDKSLVFFCAIEEGLVLSLGSGKDLLADWDRCLTDAQQAVGGASVLIGFDCILRRLELRARDQFEAAKVITQRHNLIGFHTYGEQRGGVHVNQTFTGVALGVKA